MKTLLILIMTPLLSWAQPISSQSSSQNLNAYQLVKAFDANVAKQMPNNLKKTKIQNLKIHKDTLSFQMSGAKFVLTLLKDKAHVLRFNGKLFSSEEIQAPSLARRSLVKKFGLNPKQISWLSLFIQQAWANTPGNPTGETMGDAFHSYNFVPEKGPFDITSTSVAELPELIGKSNTREALAIFGSLLTAVGSYSKSPAFTQALDLGVPSQNLPIAPNFSTSAVR